MFEKITAAPADPILGLGEAFKSETRSNKINLGLLFPSIFHSLVRFENLTLISHLAYPGVFSV